METTRGHPCKNRAYGRLMACKNEPSHDVYKRDAFLRLLGFQRGGRPITAPASHARTPRASTEPDDTASPPATVESRQQALTLLTIALTLIGTAATVVQTVLTA
ncbi:hypothetical protein [Actinomadura sp. 3N508]|uniref:hypothetical protein n=1 Tax=Actinomadura sp. 3N508 TaxID=3375153 RepID=UPI00378A770D